MTNPTPFDLPPHSKAAGRGAEVRLRAIKNTTFSLCNYMTDKGYSFNELTDPPLAFFEEAKEGPQAAADLVRFLLTVLLHDDGIEQAGGDPLAPNQVPKGFNLNRN